jgi:hypothetical protein
LPRDDLLEDLYLSSIEDEGVRDEVEDLLDEYPELIPMLNCSRFAHEQVAKLGVEGYTTEICGSNYLLMQILLGNATNLIETMKKNHPDLTFLDEMTNPRILAFIMTAMADGFSFGYEYGKYKFQPKTEVDN